MGSDGLRGALRLEECGGNIARYNQFSRGRVEVMSGTKTVSRKSNLSERAREVKDEFRRRARQLHIVKQKRLVDNAGSETTFPTAFFNEATQLSSCQHSRSCQT